MEESITLLTKIKEAFACEGQDVRAYSPLTLAYICLLYTSDAADE